MHFALTLLFSILLLLQYGCHNGQTQAYHQDILFSLRSIPGYEMPGASQQWLNENRACVLYRSGELLRPTGRDASSFELGELDEHELSEIMELLTRIREAKKHGEGDWLPEDVRYHSLVVYGDAGDCWRFSWAPFDSRSTPQARLMELIHSARLRPPY